MNTIQLDMAAVVAHVAALKRAAGMNQHTPVEGQHPFGISSHRKPYISLRFPGHLVALGIIKFKQVDVIRILATFEDLYSGFSFAYLSGLDPVIAGDQLLEVAAGSFPFPVANVVLEQHSSDVLYKIFEGFAAHHEERYGARPQGVVIPATVGTFLRVLERKLTSTDGFGAASEAAFNHLLTDWLAWYNRDGLDARRSPVSFLDSLSTARELPEIEIRLEDVVPKRS